MSQLLGLVTRMYIARKVRQIEVRTTERYRFADADRQNILEPPTNGGYLCSDPISTYIFTTYDSISLWNNVDDTKAAGQIK